MASKQEFLNSARRAVTGFENAGEIMKFLESLHGHDWFSKVGSDLQPDARVERVWNWEDAVRAEHENRILEAFDPFLTQAYSELDDQAYHDAVNVGDLAQEVFMRENECWDRAKTPNSLNLAYGMLGETVGIMASLIFVGHVEGRQLADWMFSYSMKGFWTCGWKKEEGKLIIF